MTDPNSAGSSPDEPNQQPPDSPTPSRVDAVNPVSSLNSGAVPTNPPTNPPAKKGRRRRFPIWLRVVAVVVLLLILLVVFAPTIASTGPVRKLVLGRVNESLNGRVEAEGWSLGWTSGLQATGVRVFDAAGRQILQLSSVTTELTLLDAIRGNYTLGEVVIDGLDFLLRREADGEFNFAKLAKAEASAPTATPAPAQPAPADPAQPAAAPSKLPNLSGNVVIRNSRGTFEDVTKSQTVQFASIDGNIKIPDINGPIDHALAITAATPDGQRGTLKVGGTVDLIENNEVRVEAANVEETIEIAGVALPAVAAFFPPGSIDTMRGDANMLLQVSMKAGQGGFVQGEVTSDGFAASGPALKGDTLQAKRLVVTIPRTSIDMSAGHGSWANWPIRTGGDQPAPIRVALVQDGREDAVTLAVNATPQSLMNLAQNLKPAAAGQVDLGIDVDLGTYARQLPRVFQGQDGRRLNTAMLDQTMRITLVPDRASIDEKLALTEITLTNPDGTPAKLEPIQLALKTDTLGGGWAMPELREVRLTLDSGFAKAQFGGAEISKLTGSATGDLARTQAELSPFLPMEGMQLGGTFDVKVESTGDVATADAPAKLTAGATFADLQLHGVAGFENFRQGYTFVQASADVIRAAGLVTSLRDAKVISRTGESEQALMLDTELTATVEFKDATQTNPATGQPETVRVVEIPEYDLQRFTADLAAAQRDFPEQFTALNAKGLSIDSGVLSLTGSGSYRADAIAFDVKGGVDRLNLTAAPAITSTASATLVQVPPPAGRSDVLRDYTLSIDAAGTHAPGDESAVTRLSRLAIADNQKMISLAKGEPELVIATGAAGVQPSGEVRLGADVKKLNDAMRAFSGAAADAAQLAAASGEDVPKAAELESGRLDGALKLGPAADGLLALNGTLDLTRLTVRTESEPIENEKVAVALKLRSKGDFSYLNIDELTATGRLVNAKVTDTALDFAAADAPGAPPLAMVSKAKVLVEFTDLKDLHALWRAISPPEPEPQPAVVVAKPQGAGDRTRDAVPEAPAAERRPLRFEKPTARADEPRGDEVIGRRPGRGQAVEPRRELPEGPADPDGSVTLAPADDAPPPPALLRGGTATLGLTVGREGGQIVVTPDLVAKNVSFQAGDVSKQVGDLSLKTSVRLVPAASVPEGASFLEGLRELNIPSLVLRGAGAEIKLDKPLVVKDPAVALGAFGAAAPTTRPAGSPAPKPSADAVLSAVLSGTIDMGEFFSVLEACQGTQPGKGYPYDGAAKFRQELSTAGGVFQIAGQFDVNDFAMTGEGAAPFVERHVGLANSITLDGGADVLRFEKVALTMQDTKAVQLTVTGAIHELSTARRFEGVVVKLGYDAAKLWDVLRPIMDPETGGKSLEEITLAGGREEEIRIEGTYPANDPNAIRSLRATGGFALDTLATRGLTVADLDLRFLLEQGVLRIRHAEGPAKPATPAPQPEVAVAAAAANPPGARCNGDGIFSVHDFRFDMTGEHPRLIVPDGHALIRDVSINPVVADSIIGRFVNPAFAGADQARGILSVTVNSCRGLALDSAMQSPDPEISGRAELTWSLAELMLGQPELVALVTRIKPNALNEPGFEGEIKDGKIVIEGGQVYSDLMMKLDKYTLGFNGGIGLAENKLVNFSVALPPALFTAIDDKFEKVVPNEGYKVALTGTTDNWIGNATNSILPIVADLGIRSAAGRLFNRETDEEKAERRRRERAKREARERREKVPDDAAAPKAEDKPDGDEVIGRRPGDAAAPDAEPSDPDADAPEAEPKAPDDPLGDLLERAIGGKRETDAEKKARRERVRQERREREERERQQRERQQQPPPPGQ